MNTQRRRDVERAFSAESTVVDLLNTALCRASSIFADQVEHPDRFHTDELLESLRAILPQLWALDEGLNEYAIALINTRADHFVRADQSTGADPPRSRPA